MTNSTVNAPQPVPTSGEGQWVLVEREFRKRRLAVAAALVILSLVIVSILAPILANDRPIYYVGVNRFEFREAMRTLRSSTERFTASRMSEPELRDRNEKLTSATQKLITTAIEGPKASASPALAALAKRIQSSISGNNLLAASRI